jgi:hypothetical protein
MRCGTLRTMRGQRAVEPRPHHRLHLAGVSVARHRHRTRPDPNRLRLLLARRNGAWPRRRRPRLTPLVSSGLVRPSFPAGLSRLISLPSAVPLLSRS